MFSTMTPTLTFDAKLAKHSELAFGSTTSPSRSRPVDLAKWVLRIWWNGGPQAFVSVMRGDKEQEFRTIYIKALVHTG